MIEGMSAANAAVDISEAAPAAMKYLTLRIGIVLLTGEADRKSPTSKNPRPDDRTKTLSGT
jgi:hypothetical protein